MFQEDIRCAVRENESRLDEFSAGSARRRRLEVPGPSEVGPAAHELAQHDQSVPEEDTALDEVGETAENTVIFLLVVS